MDSDGREAISPLREPRSDRDALTLKLKGTTMSHGNNANVTRVDKVLHTAKTHTTGGREGASRSSDGRLDIKLSSPGSTGPGTNPEQLFAAWLVGLFRRGDGTCRPQEEDCSPH